MAAKSNTTVRDMTRQELNAWLLEKGIDKEYCVLLTEDQKIDGRTFVDLTEAELKSELSITKFGPRKQILRLIEEANEQDEEKPSMLCYSYDDSPSQSSNGATGLDADPEARGASLPYGTGVLWNKPILKVHFTTDTDTDTDIPIGNAWVIDGQPITTRKILELANEWSSNGRDCVPKFEPGSFQESDIRVKFRTSGGSKSYIGSRAQGENPSMDLNLGVGGNDYKKYLVRHEFGHALGLGHEHQSKNAPSGLLNREAVIDWLVKKGKMSKKEAEEKYEGDYKEPDPDDRSDSAIASPYDKRSIMQYWILPEWINKDHQYARKHPDILKNGINNPPQHTLSDIDTQEIVQHYKGLASGGVSSLMNHSGQASGGAGPKVVSDDSSVKTDPGQASGGAGPKVVSEDSSVKTDPDERPKMRKLQLIKWNKGGEEKQVKIIADTAPHWVNLGTTFGISQAELGGFRTQNMLNEEGCCRSVLQRWLQNGSQPRDAYPVTWRGLIKALRDTSLREIADQLETALCYICERIQD